MKTYFISDVHLGLQVADPSARERRFADFLLSLPEDTDAVYLLGDIWDFWYALTVGLNQWNNQATTQGGDIIYNLVITGSLLMIIPLVIGRVKRMKWEVIIHEHSKIRK